MRRTRSTAHLADLLPIVLKGLQAERRPTLEAIQAVWRRVVGARAARHSWPRRLTRGRLLVAVENSGWMYALGLRKVEFTQGLIELLGAGRVKGVSLFMGEKEGKDA